MSLYSRESYLLNINIFLPLFAAIEQVVDNDDSESHVRDIINSYKEDIDACNRRPYNARTNHFNIAMKNVLQHGLEMEEALLKNIQEINNNAKSARIKKWFI